MSSELISYGKSSAGGSEAAISSSDADKESSLVASGYTFLANAGNWLFKYPKGLINVAFGFFGLPEQFASVATAILITIIVIIVISSILKNRL